MHCQNGNLLHCLDLALSSSWWSFIVGDFFGDRMQTISAVVIRGLFERVAPF